LIISRKALQAEKVNDKVERRIMAYDEQLMLAEVHLQKGGVGALHAHPHHQVDYVVKGSVLFELEGKRYAMEAGDSVVIPPNARHGATALEDSILLDIFSPMRGDFLKSDKKER